MENLTDKEKDFLKFLLRIGVTLTSSNTAFSIRDNANFEPIYFDEVWQLAQKLGIDEL